MAADPPTPVPRRPQGEGGQDAISRLADQLHSLSRLAETLTVRVLELEERLSAQEEEIFSFLETSALADPAAMVALERRLGETQDRLARLEALLRGGEEPREGGLSRGFVARRGLRAVPESLAPRLEEQHDPPDGHNPFPEEGEQPFMDERIA